MSKKERKEIPTIKQLSENEKKIIAALQNEKKKNLILQILKSV